MTEETLSPPTFTMQLFGPMRVTVGGLPLPRLRNRGSLWILALLALRDAEVSREWLAGVLWPESLPAQAAYNLRRNLSELRAAMGYEARRICAPNPQSLRLDTARADIDIHEFTRRLKRGTAADLDAAIACYTGDLLEGCDLEWIGPERLRHREAYLDALEKRAARHAETNEPARAASLLRLLLSREPLRETAHCRLLEALAAQGHFAEVTQAQRAFRLRLHTETQSAPRPETNALYARLKSSPAPNPPAANPPFPASDTRRPAPFSAPLPNPLTALIGRERELDELESHLQTARLVTLKGPGGSGKTRLAMALGQRMRPHFAEQVWFVSLAELPDAERLPETVCAALRLQSDLSGPFAQIVARLAAQPSLLILDNYEHLIPEGTGFVRELLASAPLLRCLVTSRHSLHLRGEIEYQVAPLECPQKAESVPRLRQCSSVQLFLERAAARRADFRLTPENAETIATLCAKLEGVPLALELVAAWSDALAPAQMLARLEARFSFPANPHSESPERHRSLQTAFDGSYALLDDAERRLLRRLSVFAGGWTLEAAEAVCSEAGQTEEGVLLTLLKRLVEKSLVQFQGAANGSGSPSRYQLQEMTRQYAQERLESAERLEIERRHADYYFQLAQAGEAEIERHEIPSGQQRKMMPDKENYMAAYQRWQARDPNTAIDLMLTLGYCGIWQMTAPEQDEWIARVETQPLPPPSPLQARLYYHMAFAAMCRTLPAGTGLMKRAALLAEACDEPTYFARALLILTEQDRYMGNTERAWERLNAALDCATRAEKPLYVASAQYQLIGMACEENDLPRAREMSEALLQSGRERDYAPAITRALDRLSDIAIQEGDMARGRDYMEQELAAYPESEWLPRSNTLRALGRLAARQEDYGAAQNYLARSLALCQESGDLSHEAWTYHDLAAVAHRQGNDAKALEWERQALRLFDLCSQIGSMATCLFALARWSANQPEQAVFLWAAQERLAQESGYLLSPEQQAERDAACASLQITLTEPVCLAIWERCAALSLREVIHSACSESPSAPFDTGGAAGVISGEVSGTAA